MKTYLLSIFEKKKGEIDALNGIRAIGILMVMTYHLWVSKKQMMSPMPDILLWFIRNQLMIVDVFFVLGGFLSYYGVLSSYAKEGAFPYKKFLVNRSLRILPAYYFALAFSYFYARNQIMGLASNPNPSPELVTLIAKGQAALGYIWSDVLFVSNYFPRVMDVGWYVSMEQQCYLVLVALGPFFLFNKTLRTRVIILTVLYFIPLACRFVEYSHGTMDYFATFYTQNRFDSLVAGMLLAEYVVWRKNKGPLTKSEYYAFFALGTLLLGLSYTFDWDHWIRPTLTTNFYNLGIAVLILLGIQDYGIVKKVLGSVIFRPIARVSFTAYLWNIPLMGIATRWALRGETVITPWVLPKFYIVCFGFTFLVSWIIFLVIEQPILWWRDRPKSPPESKVP